MHFKTIETESVNIKCYCCDKNRLDQCLEDIESNFGSRKEEKPIKIIVFVIGLVLKEYSDVQQALKNSYKSLFDKYSLNLLMISKKQQFDLLVLQIQSANGSEFEFNYLKLQEISERSIKENILQTYIEKKFKWSQVKAKYFLEKHKVTSLFDVLKYSSYPQWQKTLVSKTLSFQKYCKQVKERQQQPQLDQNQ